MFDEVTQFSNVAGPKLNIDKTEGLWLGNFKAKQL
jgi:hypothetical protein